MTEIKNQKQTLLKINYKDYPEFMFAMIAAYLPKDDGVYLRKVAGEVVFRHEKDGCTYKNGVLHSYDDKPAIVIPNWSWGVWCKDGKIHRDNDRPAHEGNNYQIWYRNGKIHRDGDLPANI